MIKRLSVIIALGIALSLSACGNTAKVNEPIEAEKVTEAIESTPEVTEEPETATEEAEELSVIYADDEEINLYLNRYNEANVGQEITADQFEPYKHHGSVHKNQIKFKTEETTISATGTKVTVYLEYKDLEQYKEAFLRFVKPFSDTDIEKCWVNINCHTVSSPKAYPFCCSRCAYSFTRSPAICFTAPLTLFFVLVHS